jgi:PKD repeat protein
MQLTLIRLLVTFCCWLPIFASAATQSIHVEWGYTPPSEPAVTGFKLYQEGVSACQVQDPNATAMDCEVTLTAATTNFTLTASFSDNTESPHSAPFAFTTTDATVPDTTPNDDTTPKTPVPDSDTAVTGSGSKLFTFSWDTTADQTSLTGYRVYLNNALLCETTTPTATTLACRADLIQGTMTFSMTQVAATGLESAPSNLLVFDPTAYPEMFTAKLITLSWEYPTGTTITGFRAYQNSMLIGETNDPTARALECTADITSGAVTYGVTAINPDGSETTVSNLLTYNADSTATDTTALKAVITASTTNGPAPLSVGFNASASTGTIISYLWDFGDGATATTQTVNHIYTNAGTYTARLTLTDNVGQTNTANVAVTASSAPVMPATPPTAVISSSAATGPAPLTVSFDGSGSTATNATLTAYNWSFGDGGSATSSKVSHAYTTAGTFTATLTVIDSKGQTSEVGTPVIVTAPVVTNKAPQAVISATPTSGSAPLTVSFDGGGSTDSDGTISSYVWNFGDGSSATGKTVSHTYTTEATFTATLQVTDNQGGKGSTSVTITAIPKESATEVKMETGEVMVGNEWVRVPLTTPFANPIVIAGPPSFSNSEPCVIRLRNVNSTGFDIRLTEWNYQDGAHPQESVSYLVMEKGRHTLPNGSSVEAGAYVGTTYFKSVPFSKSFAKAPVILTTIASFNETDTISGRIKSVTASGFGYYFWEQEKNKNVHLNETVNFIAWEPGTGTIGSVQFEAANTANAVTHVWHSAAFQTPAPRAPLLLADMQTTNSTETSALRVQQINGTGFQVKVEEEQSKDSEVSHSVETVGYLSLNQPEEKVQASFTWDYDAALEATINGFQILANGDPICTSDSATTRQLSCEINKPAGPTTFAIQAMEKTGSNSTSSNTITYTP